MPSAAGRSPRGRPQPTRVDVLARKVRAIDDGLASRARSISFAGLATKPDGFSGCRHSRSSLDFLAWVVRSCDEGGRRASVAFHSLIATSSAACRFLMIAYNAFISYSHEADEALAADLERALEKLARPWYKRRALSVFRDGGNLNLSSHLWRSIQNALDASDFFIYLASPAAARSPWVAREIEYRFRIATSIA